MEKNRLDIFLVNNKLAKSRNFAQNLITDQKVKVNNKIVIKHNYLISSTDKVEIIETTNYVSRGAYKLKAAINHFKINLDNLVAVDIGASTGGFSQVMLENNIKKIYAIDVGTDQLD
ncbi:MAG: TlyA family RNA methyltransferase, partial [Malacoplasma sp.]|nr:TlyA family RNA methyltransferase [Malacoplasma sp.]